MTFVVIIGGACFFLIGCSQTPKRLIDVADMPNNQNFSETDCEIKQKKHNFEDYAHQTERLIDLKRQRHIKELEQLRITP